MIKTTTRTYDAFFFRQRPKAPVQSVFVATSADIFDWAAVPRKTSKDIRNFQRPEIQRHIDEIRDYFAKYAENCSPSSIVVGFQKKATCTQKDGNPLDTNAIQVGQLVQGQISITFVDPVDLDFVGKRELVRDILKDEAEKLRVLVEELKRDMAPGETVLAVEDESEGSGKGDVGAVGGEGDDEETEAGQTSEDEGQSADELDAAEMLDETLARLGGIEAIDVGALDDDQVGNLLQIVLDSAKPGLIIDGQHRVSGTKAMKVYFPVTALPDAPWPELAFQFIVLNRSAKQVPDRLLINIVGKSLTEDELTGIEKRLNDSGIPVPLYQGVMRLHDDPDSPFYGKLRFGVRDEAGIIDAASAKTKIVNYWFECKVYSVVRHMLAGKTKRERIQSWQMSGMWYEFLKVFWGEAKKSYAASSTLWSDEVEKDGKTPVSKLMRVTIINLTQQAVMEQMYEDLHRTTNADIDRKTTMESLVPDVEAFRKRVEFYIRRLKPDFFQDWGDAAKGFDGSKHVRESYKRAVRLIVSGDKSIESLKKDGKDQHLLYMKGAIKAQKSAK